MQTAQHKNAICDFRQTMLEVEEWARAGYTLLSMYPDERGRHYCRRIKLHGAEVRDEPIKELDFFSRVSSQDIVNMFKAAVERYGKKKQTPS